jgi:hypothetical protein
MVNDRIIHRVRVKRCIMRSRKASDVLDLAASSPKALQVIGIVLRFHVSLVLSFT